MTTEKKATARKPASNKAPANIEAGQALDLVKLSKIGGLITGKATPRPVSWVTTNENGEEVTYEFIVGVVKLGLAATERIWAAPSSDSRWAMLIHETIRLGDDFKQRIPYEDACRLEPSLFHALSAESSKVNPKPEPSDAGEEGND